MATGFEKYSVAELRDALVNNGWTEEQAAGVTGKQNLVAQIIAVAGGVEEAGRLLEGTLDPYDDVEVEDDIINMDEVEFEEEVDSTIPTDKDYTNVSYDSPEWSNFVMEHFNDDELTDGNPTVPGLRRVASKLLGDIVVSGPVSVQTHFPDNPMEVGRACVTYEVQIAWAFGLTSFVDERLPVRVFRAVAGSYLGNTDDDYAIYPEAIAETRAEGRALRKALGLKSVVCDEELTSKSAADSVNSHKSVFDESAREWSADQPIEPSQAAIIDLKCKALDISVEKFINLAYYEGRSATKAYESINDVPRGMAGHMVKQLTKYQSNTGDKSESSNIPEVILGYEENEN